MVGYRTDFAALTLLVCPGRTIHGRHEVNADDKLKQDILDELARALPACHALFSVHVRRGMATLNGHAPTPSEKWAAVFAGLRVPGVVALAVNVTAGDEPVGANRAALSPPARTAGEMDTFGLVATTAAGTVRRGATPRSTSAEVAVDASSAEPVSHSG